MDWTTCTWNDLGYEMYLTDDGSPTLIVKDPARTDDTVTDVREKMHSWEGAFSETIHLYEPAVTRAFTETTNVHLISVGLGLGYVEILYACVALRQNRSDFSGESYEKNSSLSQIFLQYLHDRKVLNAEIRNTYDRIFELYEQLFAIPCDQIIEALEKWILLKKLILRDELNEATRFQTPPTIYIWDAYGRRFSQALWSAPCLENALGQASKNYGVFASYASFVPLKKQLAAFGFEDTKKRGFGKKRESTIFFRPKTF